MGMAIEKEKIIEALNYRYAVKKFDPARKIPEKDWNVLEESLRLAPSSYGLQAWKFVIVQNPEVRKRLKPHSWDQSQVEDASHLVVITYKKKIEERDIEYYIDFIAKERNKDVSTLQDFKKGMIDDVVYGPRSKDIFIWTQRQTYIAMGFLLETAALLGIDACPMEGIDTNFYDEELKLEKIGYATIAAVALGYRATDDNYQELKKVRFPSTEVFIRI